MSVSPDPLEWLFLGDGEDKTKQHGWPGAPVRHHVLDAVYVLQGYGRRRGTLAVKDPETGAVSDMTAGHFEVVQQAPAPTPPDASTNEPLKWDFYGDGDQPIKQCTMKGGLVVYHLDKEQYKIHDLYNGYANVEDLRTGETKCLGAQHFSVVTSVPGTPPDTGGAAAAAAAPVNTPALTSAAPSTPFTFTFSEGAPVTITAQGSVSNVGSAASRSASTSTTAATTTTTTPSPEPKLARGEQAAEDEFVLLEAERYAQEVRLYPQLIDIWREHLRHRQLRIRAGCDNPETREAVTEAQKEIDILEMFFEASRQKRKHASYKAALIKKRRKKYRDARDRKRRKARKAAEYELRRELDKVKRQMQYVKRKFSVPRSTLDDTVRFALLSDD